MPDYKKYFTIPASTEDVYLALTKATALQLWTGYEAVFEELPNTEFSLWDDMICGKNLAFEPYKMIQQEWYFGDEWQDSIVTLKLHEKSKDSTSLEVNHVNIPNEAFENIVEGWEQVYVPALVDFFYEAE